MTDGIRDAVFGSSAVVVLFDAFLNSFDLLLAMSDLLFPMMAVVSGTIAPEIEFLSEQMFTHLLLFVAALYVINLLSKLRRRYQNETNND